jgi:hypothetical protein
MADNDQLPAELPTEPPKYADIVLDEGQIAEARRDYPDVSEGKAIHYKKLSILAKMRHAYVDPSTGRHFFGGPQPNSGRKSTKRIGEALVEAAQGRHKEIVDAAFAPIAKDSGADPIQRHKAALNLAKLEREERALDMAEDEFVRKTEDEVRSDATKVLAKMVATGKLSLEDIVRSQRIDADAEAEEIPEADVA